MRKALSHAALLGLMACIALSDVPALGEDSSPPSSAAPTLWIIPHTHWEGAVFKTREEYLQLGLPNILQALRLLKKYPDYHFVLDQVAYVKPFLERYPEEEAAFRKFVAEGRLQLVLGMDVMPDVNMPGGETLVRQIQYGKKYYRDKLGVDATVAWLVDTFGHNGQMPQVLKLGGYKTFWFSRGVPRRDHPSEFLWEGIDGTQIPAFWLPYSYGLFYDSPSDPVKFKAFAQERYDMLGRNTRRPDRVACAGADVSVPEERLAPMVEGYNKRMDAPLRLRLATPTEFEAAVLPGAGRPEWPVFKGELNPIFQGTYSSRIELKQRMRLLQQKLTAAEKLTCLARWLGANVDDGLIWRAWEPVLFSETHDCASGVMTDHVYQDTVASYEFSNRLADQIIDDRWNEIAARIDTKGSGPAQSVPVVVFNTLGWTRSDLAGVTVGFAADGVVDVRLVDEAGRQTPVQLSEEARYPGGGIQQAKVTFIARDVPALGYATYHVVPTTVPPTPRTAPLALDTLDNELYRMTFDPHTGEIKSLVVKDGNREVFTGGANVVARQVDHGDLWELYRGLDGGSNIAMTTLQQVPTAADAKLSNRYLSAAAAAVRDGPVFREFDVSHPFDTGTFATRVRLYTGLRRIEIRTRIVNREKYVRYQALFPTTIRNGRGVHAIPFGAIERPAGVEFPAQEWVDYSDGRHGLALLNWGHPGNVVTDGTMMLSLLRAHNLGAYGFGGGYEPGMSSETGFELDQERTLSYALVPHSGDWREAGIYRDGIEFNNPLIVRKASAHGGVLPARWGLIDVSHANVVLSAVQPGHDDSVLLRVYEAAGLASHDVKLKLHAHVIESGEVNLMQDPIRDLAATDDTLRFDLHPFEIKTFKLRLRPLM